MMSPWSTRDPSVRKFLAAKPMRTMKHAPAIHTMALQSSDLERLSASRLPAQLPPELSRAMLDWARTVESGRPLEIHFVTAGATSTATQDAAIAVREHFLRLAEEHTQKIKDIFRYARVTSVVGLLVLAVLLATAQAIPDDAGRLAAAIRESLTIFAWVAMWKPADLWLYAHWPERYWRRQALRLAEARICVLAEAVVSKGPAR
jgi:hypothetical protein